MSDEQTTSGNSLNPAADAHAPRQAAPVMDVVPPQSQPSVGPEVVAAPPEDAIPPVSDEIADQIAADATTPPVSAETPTDSSEASQPASDTEATAEGPHANDDKQTSAVHAELERQNQTHEITKLPKVANPGRSAAIITVIGTIVLAALAVFAYMSAQ